METTRICYSAIAATAIAVLLAACVAATNPATSEAGVSVGDNRSRWRGHRRGRTGSRRMGDRGDDRPADQVRQDRGHRRARTLLVPDLPKANYQRLGARLRAGRLAEGESDAGQDPEPARRYERRIEAAAAQYYPPIYWYSMLKIPAKSEFPGRAALKDAQARDQADWLTDIKTGGCMSCHALGTVGTRTIPKELAQFKSADGWARRITAGQAMTQMIERHRQARLAARPRTVRRLDRSIAAGELPFDKAGAAAGHGTQHRAHAMGLEHAHRLHA